MARSRRAATRPERTALADARGELVLRASCTPPRASAPASCSRAAPGPATRVAIALPAGLEFAQALHACLLLGAVAVPVDLRLAPAERALIVDGRRGAGRGAAAARAPRCRRACAAADATSSTPTAVVIHTSGTTAAPRPVELTYGNILWSALGSAVALGLDPRGALAVRAAAVARRRAVDPAALGDLRDERGRPRALRDRPRAARAARRSDVTLVEPRRDDARAAARRRTRASAGAALRAHRRRPGAGGARWRAPARPACRSASPTASPRAARR